MKKIWMAVVIFLMIILSVLIIAEDIHRDMPRQEFCELHGYNWTESYGSDRCWRIEGDILFTRRFRIMGEMFYWLVEE